jgi:hypothetical protein
MVLTFFRRKEMQIKTPAIYSSMKVTISGSDQALMPALENGSPLL